MSQPIQSGTEAHPAKGVRLQLGDEMEARTHSIIGASYQVFKELGDGLPERVYERAMMIELQARGHDADQQREVPVTYRGVEVGKYKADIVVDGQVVVELKSAAAIVPAHKRQTLNYVRALGVEVGLVINFGPEKAEVARVVDFRHGKRK